MAFGCRPLQDRRGFLFASLLGFAGRLGLALSFAFGRLGLNLLVALLCSILVLQLVESLHFQLILAKALEQAKPIVQKSELAPAGTLLQVERK